MNIKDKLRLLDKLSPQSYQPATQATTDVEALAAMLGGEVVENGYGCFIRFRHTIPLTRRHGQIELSGTTDITGKTLSILSKKSVSAAFDLSTALYIDTETTGLAGGTGTYVFLIGAGYIEENEFIIEQLFLPRLTDEQAMLEYLNGLFANHKGIVSFNGKSFDLPLIITRFIANRMKPLIDMHEHLDLLHAARRIWKNDFGDCRLGTLEASLMGFERFEDIPGEEIPYIYMEFLRYGRTERLTPVLSHNNLDIVSLLALVIVLSEKIEKQDMGSLPTKEAGRIAKLHENIKSFDRAAEFLNHLGERKELSGQEKCQHLLSHARIQKKLGRYEEAVKIWLEATAYGSLAIEAYLEIAKHYEHRDKDFDAALKYTNKAIAILKTRMALQGRTLFDQQQRQLRHRAERLVRKMERLRG